MGRSNQRLLKSECRYKGLSDISLFLICPIACPKMACPLNIVYIHYLVGLLAIHQFEQANPGDFGFQENLSKVFLGDCF